MIDEEKDNVNGSEKLRYSQLLRERASVQDALVVTQQALTRYALDAKCMSESVAQAYRDEHQRAKKRLNEIDEEVKTLSFSDDDSVEDDTSAENGKPGNRKETKERSKAEQNTEKQAKKKSFTLTKLADVTPQPIRWLWRGYIPFGKVTILDGDPGLGKSLLSLDIAARASQQRTLPDGTLSDLNDPAGVVLLSLEDDPADTIRPRLEAADADLERIVLLTAITAETSERLPTLADLDAIRHAIESVKAKLVIIDPLMAYLPGDSNSHKDQDIRRTLAPLAALAAETGVAVVVIRHLNKTEGRNPLYRGGGSIGIIGAARSGLIVAKDPDDENRRILAVAKSNLAKPAPALAYRIESTAEEIPYLFWEGVTTHTASSLLAQQNDTDEDRSALEEAKDFLRDVLRDGAVPAKETQRQAEEAGINLRTLRRAKEALHLTVKKRGGFFSKGVEKQKWCWQLPLEGDQDPPEGDQDPPEGDQDPPEDDQTSENGHLQQSSEKNTRKFNGVAEDDQTSENGHLQRKFGHLQRWEEDV